MIAGICCAIIIGLTGCSDVVQEVEPNESLQDTGAEAKSEIMHSIDEMPTIVGGMASIVEKIVYPEGAKADKVEGRVLVQFVVDTNGDVVDPQVIKGVDSRLDEEALRVVREIKFVPGKHEGAPAKVKLTLPITFKLQ